MNQRVRVTLDRLREGVRIEDDASVRDFVVRALTRRGHRRIAAAEGEEALTPTRQMR